MKLISLTLSFILMAISVEQSHASFKMLPTLDVVEGTSLSIEREKVMGLLKTEKIQKQLISMGINPAEAMQRVVTLSESEVKKLSERIADLPAGADGLGSIVGAALLIFIILLITDILGYTQVFPFTRPVK